MVAAADSADSAWVGFAGTAEQLGGRAVYLPLILIIGLNGFDPECKRQILKSKMTEQNVKREKCVRKTLFVS